MRYGQNFWQKLVNKESTKLIAVVDIAWGISKNGKIPWSFEEDRKFFQEMTRDSTVIMGRKTFESIPGPLRDRTNCVISRSTEPNLANPGGVEVFKSLEGALKIHKDSWVIGGAEVYNYALENCLIDYAFVTQVFRDFKADKFVRGTLLESSKFFNKSILKNEKRYRIALFERRNRS